MRAGQRSAAGPPAPRPHKLTPRQAFLAAVAAAGCTATLDRWDVGGGYYVWVTCDDDHTFQDGTRELDLWNAEIGPRWGECLDQFKEGLPLKSA